MKISGNALIVSALMATAAHAATLPATTSDFWAVINGSSPGDVVQLASGNYGGMDLYNIRKSGAGVLITPAPGATVTGEHLALDGSSGLTFRGAMTFTSLSTTQYALELQGTDHITIDGLSFHGSSCALGQLTGVGAWFRSNPSGAAMVVQNTSFTCYGSGIGVLDADGITLDKNTLSHIGTDAILLVNSTHAVISRNTGTIWDNSVGGHPDFIQFSGTTVDIKITGNRYEAGTGDESQCIFGEDGTTIDIEDNVCLGAAFHGISLARSANFTINHNFVQSVSGDSGSWIMVRQEANNGVVSNNVTPALIVGVPNEPQPTNITQTANTVLAIAMSSPTDYTQVNLWLGSSPPTGPVSPPIVTPPTTTPTGPLQASIDSLNVTILSLKAKINQGRADVNLILRDLPATIGNNPSVKTLKGYISKGRSDANKALGDLPAQ